VIRSAVQTVSIRKRKAAARDERAFYSYGGQDSAVQGQDRIRIQRSFGLLCHHLCERYHRFRTMGTRAEHGRALCTRSDLVRVREMSSRRAGSWDAVGPTDMSSRRLGEQHCHGVVTAQGCCSSSCDHVSWVLVMLDHPTPRKPFVGG
jgi:hypothetical protein